MPRAVITIASNPRAAEVEDAYNRWYSGSHLPDIRATPGVVAARRFRLAPSQLVPGAEAPHRYLLVAELDVDDLGAAVRQMTGNAAASPEAAELMELDPLPAVTVWEAIE